MNGCVHLFLFMCNRNPATHLDLTIWKTCHKNCLLENMLKTALSHYLLGVDFSADFCNSQKSRNLFCLLLLICSSTVYIFINWSVPWTVVGLGEEMTSRDNVR